MGRFRGAGASHQDDDVTAVQFGVGAGGEDHRLAPPDGHDGAAGGLPELQLSDAFPDQEGILWNRDLVVGKRLAGSCEGILALDQGRHRFRHAPVHLCGFRQQVLQLTAQRVDVRVLGEVVDVPPGAVGGEDHGPALGLYVHHLHIRQQPQGLADRLRGYPVLRRQHRPAVNPAALRQLALGDAGGQIQSDLQILGRDNCLPHGIHHLLFCDCMVPIIH